MMNNFPSNTPAKCLHQGHAPKSPAAQTLFSVLLRRMTKLCAAERDIAGLAQGDPAFDDWFCDAEVARMAVIEAAEDVIFATGRSCLDQRLRMASSALKVLLTARDAEPYAEAVDFLRRNARKICAPTEDRRRAAFMFRSFFEACDLLLALPDYAPETTPCDTAIPIAA